MAAMTENPCRPMAKTTGPDETPQSKDTLTRQDCRSTESGDTLGVAEEPIKHE
jgi:hypothetical protein